MFISQQFTPCSMNKPHLYDDTDKPHITDESPQDTGVKPNIRDSNILEESKNAFEDEKGAAVGRSGFFSWTKRNLLIAAVGGFLVLFTVIFVPAYVKTHGTIQQNNASISASDTNTTTAPSQSSNSSATTQTNSGANSVPSAATSSTSEYCLFGKQGALYTSSAYCQVDLNPNYYSVYNCTPILNSLPYVTIISPNTTFTIQLYTTTNCTGTVQNYKTTSANCDNFQTINKNSLYNSFKISC
jgi:hypothetical protein